MAVTVSFTFNSNSDAVEAVDAFAWKFAWDETKGPRNSFPRAILIANVRGIIKEYRRHLREQAGLAESIGVDQMDIG